MSGATMKYGRAGLLALALGVLLAPTGCGNNLVSEAENLALLGASDDAGAQQVRYDHRPRVNVQWFSVDGGGALASSGGGLQVGGTVGQPDVGEMRGGGLSVVGGFWFGPVTVGPETPGTKVVPVEE